MAVARGRVGAVDAAESKLCRRASEFAKARASDSIRRSRRSRGSMVSCRVASYEDHPAAALCGQVFLETRIIRGWQGVLLEESHDGPRLS